MTLWLTSIFVRCVLDPVYVGGMRVYVIAGDDFSRRVGCYSLVQYPFREALLIEHSIIGYSKRQSEQKHL